MKIKKVSHLDVPFPDYQSAGASGFDLCFASEDCIELRAGENRLLLCGFAFEIPEGFEGQVRPRSGHAKKGLVAAFGTIDSDYRGEVGIRLFNLSFNTHRINPFERIAQMVICPVTIVKFEIVSELTDTKRGTDGFGSTGVL